MPGASARLLLLARGYAGEFGADLGGVGVLEIVEDGQGLLPGLPGLQQLASGTANIAEVGEGIGFSPAVADGLEDAQGALIASSRLAEVAGMEFGVAQAVPDVALQVAGAVVGIEGEGRGYGPLGSAPAVAVSSGGYVSVFWRGTGGALWQAARPGGGGLNGPTRLGFGPMATGPAAGIDKQGRACVYWVGTDGNLWEVFWDGSAWQGQFNRGYGQVG